MHDDQHGTAIISSAGLLNALELANKKFEDVRIVFSGAGAAAQSCAQLYCSLGAKVENILMYDSKGLIYKGRTDLDSSKQKFASLDENIAFEDSFEGTDVFIGLSKGGIVSKEMVRKMNNDPIVFALANPDPEIGYNEAMSSRDDIIMATGRSDHPNQVNNVIGFPFIFRGAIDVRATTINEEMKLAAVRAIASLAKESVPEEVIEAYGEKNIYFGKEQFIPKPIDPRLIYYVAPAVARAAMESGVAKEPIQDWDAYEAILKNRLGLDNKLINNITEKAQRSPKRVVFAEADNLNILKAAQTSMEEGVAIPILLGRETKIRALIEEFNIELEGVLIVDPKCEEERPRRKAYGLEFFERRQRKGMTEFEAVQVMRERNHFGSMMVEMGDADAMVSGITRNYRDVIRPGIALYGVSPFAHKVACDFNLQPVMTLTSQLIAVRKHKAGESVGYGAHWTSEKNTNLGVVAVGYGDGYPRMAPEGTPILINGRLVPIVGRVSMDMLTVDLGENCTDRVGDDVILWGEGLPAEQVAQHIGTIAYELITKLTARVAIQYAS